MLKRKENKLSPNVFDRPVVTELCYSQPIAPVVLSVVYKHS